jgi:chromosome segregation ATPase
MARFRYTSSDQDKTIEKAETVVSDLIDIIQDLDDQIHEANKQNFDLDTRLDNKDAEIKELGEQLDDSKRMVACLEDELASAQDDLQRLYKELETK